MTIKQYLDTHSTLYAHSENSRKETLMAHSELVLHYYYKLSGQNHINLNCMIDKLTFDEEVLDQDDKTILAHAFEEAIYLHDLGKINSEFQRVKMGQQIPKSDYNNTNHSLLSSLLYLDIWEDRFKHLAKDEWKKAFLRYIIVIFSYIISRHHTYLEDFNLHDYSQKLNALYEEVVKHKEVLTFYLFKDRLIKTSIAQKSAEDCDFRLETEKYCISDQEEDTSLYLLAKLLYSCLVTCDFLATYEFFNQKKPCFYYLNTEDKNALIKQFECSDIYKSIQEYKAYHENPEIKPINKLRSSLFIETEEQLKRNIGQSIYYLDAPTGSGKTIISMNLALNLLKNRDNLNKIVYVFPFNTLIDQTKNKLDEWFSDLGKSYRIQVVNSVTPIVQENEKREQVEASLVEQIDYDEELLRRQLLQYPVTLTSHVNLFNHLFGIGRESNLGLATLANSVVILDEIQSYRNEIWPEMIQMLNDISEMYHIVFIIMSATLPKLDQLLERKQTFTPLVVNKRKYFSHPIFKNRVLLNYDLLNEGKLSVDRLVQIIIQTKQKHGEVRMLVELIKKASARKVYDQLKHDIPDQMIIELTGDDSRFTRKKMINLIQGTEDQPPLKDVVVIATQVIEAGVDIDMDVGMKDISLLDSEEQFLGRINRSASKKNCWAYFFDLDSASMIYKKDLRLEKDLRNLDYQMDLIDKKFDHFYQLVFNRFVQIRDKRDEHFRYFESMVNGLQFQCIANHLVLIDQKTYSLVLNFPVTIDQRILTGESTWKAFKQMLKNDRLSYAEQRVKLSMLSAQLDYFTFNTLKKPHFFDERVGNLYYIQNPSDFIEKDQFIDVWKFRPDKYVEDDDLL
ncbi:CRISPR-associated helicase Cas3' [Sporolactobacillus putidus]|uniref:CRISPR-associated helicase/endonuclease Cas3 n=1 Tax=Sporolactobacillus putidus TaxID=492735 RepID=A0A917S5W4_9BACL|nr:CRISPR-associated helicase Cas3' [Sporolactobacillus putidus]GGL59322.1 CRISPR-associated helicase/endonuclease Cas3 [Sporolactobacillus putidus]